MQFDVEPTGRDGAVIRTSGRLNMISAPELKDLVARIVREDGRSHVVVDLAGTDFMDSTGLAALISGLKTARSAGGDLRIARPGKQVTMVLELTSMDRILEPHETVEECLQ
jgi:anti-sigma B factor antagonist